MRNESTASLVPGVSTSGRGAQTIDVNNFFVNQGPADFSDVLENSRVSVANNAREFLILEREKGSSNITPNEDIDLHGIQLSHNHFMERSVSVAKA